MGNVITKEESYAMGSGTLQLKVTIGDGQIGTTSVMLGTISLGISNSINLTVGETTDLEHKTLYIESTCRDQNSSSDYTSVLIVISDGSNSKTYTYSEEATTSGGSVIYDLTIHLS